MRVFPTQAQRNYLDDLAAHVDRAPPPVPATPDLDKPAPHRVIPPGVIPPAFVVRSRWDQAKHWVRTHPLLVAAIILLLLWLLPKLADGAELHGPPAVAVHHEAADPALAVAAACVGVLGLLFAYALLGRRRAPTPAEVVVDEGPPNTPDGDAPDGWTLGFATDRGLIRGQNEDAGAVFAVGSHQVAIVADGVGGLPRGGEASTIAVRAAERCMRRSWRIAPAGHPPAPVVLLQAAFAAATAALSGTGLRCGIASPAEGLRTTLIVVIAAETRFHFAYSGDGGIMVVRSGGAVTSLMTPQKADPEALNQLAGSLGPFPHGSPVFGSAERRPGDLLVAVSDGVADRLQPSFYSGQLIAQARRLGGRLSDAAARLLTMLAGHVEDDIHVFDDNMTMALIGTGQAPTGQAPEPEQREAVAA